MAETTATLAAVPWQVSRSSCRSGACPCARHRARVRSRFGNEDLPLRFRRIKKLARSRYQVPISIAKDGRAVRYCGCNRRQHLREQCGNAGVVRLDELDLSLREGLRDYFSDTALAKRRWRRFLEALGQERQKLTKEEAAAERKRADAERRIERVKRAILDGMAGPTTAGMLKEAEADRAAAVAELEDLGRLRQAAPAIVPPAEVLASLRVEAYHDRRSACRQLVQRVELRSRRPAGRTYVVSWEAKIIPNDRADIRGVPTVFISWGRIASGRGGRRGVVQGLQHGVTKAATSEV